MSNCVHPIAVDENTRVGYQQGSIELAGIGHASLVERLGEAVQVRRFADGDHLRWPRPDGMTGTGAGLHAP